MRVFTLLRQRTFLVLFFLILSGSTAYGLPTLDPLSPLKLNLHPRIFINPKTLASIAASAKTDMTDMYNAMKTRANQLLTSSPSLGYLSMDLFNNSALLSLVALIEKENNGVGFYEQYRDRAFFYAQYIMDQDNSWDLTSLYTGKATNMGARAAGLSLIYDWLHSDLVETNPVLRQSMYDFLRELYLGYHGTRPSGTAQKRRSIFGSSYFLEYGAKPWFSLAIYGDAATAQEQKDNDDAITITMNEIHDYYVPALNMLGGALHNGWGYQTNNNDWHMLNLLAWESATMDKIFDQSFALKDYGKYFVYSLRPDNTLIKINDTDDKLSFYKFGKSKWNLPNARTILLPLLNAYDDGYAKYVIDQGDFSSSFSRMWRNLVFYKKAVPVKNPSTLPLVRFFPKTAILFGRSGWGPNDLFYTFRNRDQFGSHSDAKQNSFTIFNQGVPLAINDGNYPAGASGAPSTKSYYRRTISSNSMLVLDPSETFLNYVSAYNDGGQKFGSYDAVQGTGGYVGGYEPLGYDQVAFDASEHNTADSYFEDGAGYSYIKGDASRGYSSKVKRFVREFVHIKQNYFVIFDRVGSSNKNFKKKWLLHSIAEPSLNGTESFSCSASTGESACQGDTTAGISKSTNTNQATITNGNGRLFSKTLLPANSVVRKVGGPGYMFWIDDANADIPPVYYTPSVTGGWRLEISPQSPDDDADGESFDLFLHVLQPTSSTTSSMASTTRLSNADGNVSSGNMIGVNIKGASENFVSLFSAEIDGKVPALPVTYTVKPSANAKHFLFNMDASMGYDVEEVDNPDGSKTFSISLGSQYFSSENGVLTFPVAIFPHINPKAGFIQAGTDGTIRISFNSAVKKVSNANGDDALNPNQYSVLHPSGSFIVQSVKNVSGNTFDLTLLAVTQPKEPGQFSIQVKSVEDLKGNVVDSSYVSRTLAPPSNLMVE